MKRDNIDLAMRATPAAGAILSPCGRHRYVLWRRWDKGGELVFCMLNPSTADAVDDDPTIRKIMAFAKRLGYGAVIVVNLFSFRATDPKVLRHEGFPNTDDNDAFTQAAFDMRPVICAWGANARHLERPEIVLAWARERALSVSALRLLTDGIPEHPLYIPYECAGNLTDL